ncbi:MAG: hypothetical protein M3068_06190 [Gemmatimonadota bacterium]|nr:hypothetical protein [Gemmatimonadota bacterium]
MFGHRARALRFPVLAAAVLLVGVAVPAIAGPPWISIEYPANPFDGASRNAFLIVHSYHHQTPMSAELVGTAEGLVGSARRSVHLRFDPTSRAGVYALRKQWPAEGTWMLVISTSAHEGEGATALVDLAADGGISAVRVPTTMREGWAIPKVVTAAEIDSALRRRASAGLATRSGR